MSRLNNVRFLNGGYCLQFERLTGVRSWKARRFYAVFVAFDHPLHGRCLIDTGYGPANHKEGRRWPWLLLQWLMPTPRTQPFNSPDYLSKHRLDQAAPYKIFLSHFHPDHVGGLKLFPKATYIYRHESWERLSSLRRWNQLAEGHIPGLLPDDFQQRSLPIREQSFQAYWPEVSLNAYDYFGDGSLILIDLPGHADGHTGYLINSQAGLTLYAVDAFWDRRAFDAKANLPWISRRTAGSSKLYLDSQEKLHQLEKLYGLTSIACHCPITQELVHVPN